MKKYKQLTISISGNRKVSNAIDVVRGCTGASKRSNGCYHSCYANRLAKMAGINFKVPVTNILDKKKLETQLSTSKATWMRIGTNGDPSHAWKETTEVCKIIRDSGKTPVVMTKVWHKVSDKILKSFADSKTHIQVGLSALDSPSELEKRRTLLNKYRSYYRDGTVMKVMTLPFLCQKYKELQDLLIESATYFRFMELPIRVFKTNPYSSLIDWSKMRKHLNPISKKPDAQQTAGPLYAPSNFIEDIQSNKDGTYYLCGEVTCDTCPHACGTAW